MGPSAINGIHAALCTVSDFTTHEALFAAALGWRAGSRRRLSAMDTAARFRVSAEAEIVQNGERCWLPLAEVLGGMHVVHPEGLAERLAGWVNGL